MGGQTAILQEDKDLRQDSLRRVEKKSLSRTFLNKATFLEVESGDKVRVMRL